MAGLPDIIAELPDIMAGLPDIMAGPPFMTTDDEDAEARRQFDRVSLRPGGRRCSSKETVSGTAGVEPDGNPQRRPGMVLPDLGQAGFLTHSPTPSERFIAANTRPPTKSASASEVAAPREKTNNSSDVWALAPRSAAPVRMRPRIGPAHGAQSRPVATPSSSEGSTDASPSPCPALSDNRTPSVTSGLDKRSARVGNRSAKPNSASSAMAANRPYWFAATAHPPATAASVATAAKVSAMPNSIGNPLRTNGRSARANTKGRTGRMQGLTMVRTPPR